MADNMSSMAPPLARLGDIDPVALGMDFVLAYVPPPPRLSLELRRHIKRLLRLLR